MSDLEHRIAQPGLADSLRAIETRSAADEVQRQILDLIRNGVAKPGDRLPSETELARILHVGRSTIREAKRALIAKGLVQARGKRGAYVAEPGERSLDADTLDVLLSDQAIWDLHEAREIVEVGSIRLVVERATEEDRADLVALLDEMEVALRDDGRFWELSIEFHRRLALASHNRALFRIFEVLWQLVEGDQMPSYRSASKKRDVIEGHRQLLDSVLQADPDVAAKAMDEHLNDADRIAARAKRRRAGARGGGAREDAAVSRPGRRPHH